MSILVESLEVEVKQKSDTASKSIASLVNSMKRLREVCSATTEVLKGFNSVMQSISTNTGMSADALKAFNTVAGKTTKNIRNGFKYTADEVQRASDALVKFKMIMFAMRMPSNAPKLEQYDNAFFQMHPYIVPPTQKRIGMEEVQPEYDDNVVADVEWREISDCTALVVRNVRQATQETADFTANTETATAYVTDCNSILDRMKFAWRSIVKQATEVKDSTDSISKKTKHLWASLKRIMTYRAIRAILQVIGNTLRQGLKNAYMFSKEMNGELVDTMDRLASVWLQMKNQIGSAFSELVISLQPLLEKLMQKVISFSNRLAEIMAFMNGDDVYKKALYYQVAWDDATESAKKYKTQLLGIDEINNLTSSKSGDDMDYSQMFEYTKVQIDSQKGALAFIKNNLDSILTITKVVAGALLIWKLPVKFLSDIMRVAELVKTLKVPLGITLSVVGFGVEYLSIKDIAKNGANFKNVLGSILGGALGIAGSVIAFGTNSLLVTIPLALGISTVALAKGTKERLISEIDKSEFGNLLQTISDRVSEILAVDAQINVGINTREQALTDIKEDALKIKAIIDKAFYLDEKENKTAYEFQELKNLIESINNMKIEGLQIDLDPDGKIKQTREDMEHIVEQLLITKMQDKALEGLADLTWQKTQAERNFKDAENAYVNAIKARTKLYEDYAKSDDFSLEGLVKYKTEYEKATKVIEDSEGAYKATKKTLEDINAQYSTYNEMLSNAQNYAKDALSVTEDMSNNYSVLADSIGTVNDALEEFRRLTASTDGNGVSATGRITGSFGTPKYATGGYPEQGQLFIARESGAEMVGSIGNRTAVANNDQITSAIATATYNAMAQALAENNGSVTIQVEGDPSGMFRVMQKQARNYSRRTGNLAFE